MHIASKTLPLCVISFINLSAVLANSSCRLINQTVFMNKTFTALTLSAAFFMATAPAAYAADVLADAPAVTVTIDPADGSSLESITAFDLIVNGAETVAKKSALVSNAITISGPDGFSDTPSYRVVSGFPQVIIDGLDITTPGQYTLNIPANTFVYTVAGDDTKYPLDVLTFNYTISDFERPTATPAEGPLMDGTLNKVTLTPAEGDIFSDFNALTQCGLFPLNADGSLGSTAEGYWRINLSESNETSAVFEEINGGVTLQGGHYRLVVPAGTFKINGTDIPAYTFRYNVPVMIDYNTVLTGFTSTATVLNPFTLSFSGEVSVNSQCTDHVKAYFAEETEPRYTIDVNGAPYLINNRDDQYQIIPNQIYMHFGNDELGEPIEFDIPGDWRIEVPAQLFLVDGDYVSGFSKTFNAPYVTRAIVDPKPVDGSIEGTAPFDTITILYPRATSIELSDPNFDTTKYKSITIDGNKATIVFPEIFGNNKSKGVDEDGEETSDIIQDHTISIPAGFFNVTMNDAATGQPVVIPSNGLTLLYHVAKFKPTIAPMVDGKLEGNVLGQITLTLPAEYTVKSCVNNGMNYLLRVNEWNDVMYQPKLASWKVDVDASVGTNKVILIPASGSGVTIAPGRYCINTGMGLFTTSSAYSAPEYFYIFEVEGELEPVARPEVEPAEGTVFKEFPSKFQLLFPGNVTVNSTNSTATAALAGMWFIPSDETTPLPTSAAVSYTPTITMTQGINGEMEYDFHSIDLTARGILQSRIKVGHYELRAPEKMFTTTTGISSAYVWEFDYEPNYVDSVEGITDEPTTYTVYTITGVCVLNKADASALSTLSKGLYIINGKKVMIAK